MADIDPKQTLEGIGMDPQSIQNGGPTVTGISELNGSI